MSDPGAFDDLEQIKTRLEAIEQAIKELGGHLESVEALLEEALASLKSQPPP